jgi:hypothetical protein
LENVPASVYAVRMWSRVLQSVVVVLLCVATTTATAAPKVKLEGFAEYWLGRLLVVDGQRVQADSQTRFEGRVRSLRAIRLGYIVEVQGRRLDDGSVLAKVIEVHKNNETEVDVQLKAQFDKIEDRYRARGRMQDYDPKGNVMVDHGELLWSGPMVERVRRITESVIPPYMALDDFRVYVVINEEWNAMAAPNYSIFVYSGLLDTMDDDELAIVIGHEIAHATHEHSSRQADGSKWTDMAMWANQASQIMGAGGTVGALTDLGTMLTATTIANSYSRNAEDQADRVGLRYAYEGGYDVTKAMEIWKKFAEKYGDSPKAVNFFFGAHSRSAKRAELLDEQIDWNYADPNTEE